MTSPSFKIIIIAVKLIKFNKKQDRIKKSDHLSWLSDESNLSKSRPHNKTKCSDTHRINWLRNLATLFYLQRRIIMRLLRGNEVEERRVRKLNIERNNINVELFSRGIYLSELIKRTIVSKTYRKSEFFLNVFCFLYINFMLRFRWTSAYRKRFLFHDCISSKKGISYH